MSRAVFLTNGHLKKDWHVKNWHSRTTESLYGELIKKFQEKKFIKGEKKMFAQMLKNEEKIYMSLYINKKNSFREIY